MRFLNGPGKGRGFARRSAILISAALCATSVNAAGLSGPQPSERIPAGRVEVLALGPATAGADERELVLSLDGGKTFPVRLTGEIGPDDRAASWRVPSLPTEHAVLALREGNGGFEEEIVAVSAEFVIVSDANVPVEELWFRDGEWETREAESGRHRLPPLAFGRTGPQRWTPLDDDRASLGRPVRALLAGPGVAVVSERGPTGIPLQDASQPVRRLSSFLPLRE